MKSTLNLILFVLLIIICHQLPAQSISQTDTKDDQKGWFIAINAGIQMSGIKDEDFIPSNYSSLLNLTAGKWLGKWWGLQLGYKGLWFNAISDDIRHHYTYLYTELMVDANTLLTKSNKPRLWSLILHAGPGYFYNNHYMKSNICGNLGVQNQFRLNHQLSISIDIAAIVGWDIYQGDEDILPGVSGGLIYNF